MFCKVDGDIISKNLRGQFFQSMALLNISKREKGRINALSYSIQRVSYRITNYTVSSVSGYHFSVVIHYFATSG